MVLERQKIATRLMPQGLERVEEGIVTGYASVFDERDSYGTKMLKGAFLDTIDEEFAQNKVRFLLQHDARQPLGVIQELREDDKGLWGESKISQTTRGKDTLIELADGALDGQSVGFWTIASQWRDDETGKLIEAPEDIWDLWFNPIYAKATQEFIQVRLAEYSIVTFPAVDSARVEGVRSMMSRSEQFIAMAADDPAAAMGKMFEMIQQLRQSNEALLHNGLKEEVPLPPAAPTDAPAPDLTQDRERARRDMERTTVALQMTNLRLKAAGQIAL